MSKSTFYLQPCCCPGTPHLHHFPQITLTEVDPEPREPSQERPGAAIPQKVAQDPSGEPQSPYSQEEKPLWHPMPCHFPVMHCTCAQNAQKPAGAPITNMWGPGASPGQQARQRIVLAACKIDSFPLLELALEIKTSGGPDLVAAARTLQSLLHAMAERAVK